MYTRAYVPPSLPCNLKTLGTQCNSEYFLALLNDDCNTHQVELTTEFAERNEFYLELQYSFKLLYTSECVKVSRNWLMFILALLVTTLQKLDGIFKDYRTGYHVKRMIIRIYLAHLLLIFIASWSKCAMCKVLRL